jgi:hypothetical protein
MIGLLMNSEECETKRTWPILSHYLGIGLEQLKKNDENPQSG